MDFIQITRYSVALLTLVLFSRFHKNKAITPIEHLPLVLSFITGITIQNIYGLEATIAITCAIIIISFLKLIKPKITILFMLGALSLVLQEKEYEDKKLPVFNGEITGELDSIYEHSVTLRTNKTNKIKEKFIIYTIKNLKKIKKIKELSPGDTIKIKNIKIKKPKQNSPFRTYTMKEGISGTGFTYNLEYEFIKKIKKRAFLINRHELFTRLQKKIPKKTFSFFASLFLGEKTYRPTSRTFYYWGIAHHLARSGLHIALFILIWAYLLSLLPIPFAIKQITLVAICCSYAALSWMSISFIRALSILLIFQLGKICNKQANFLYTLQLIALAVLSINPIQLIFLDYRKSV